MRSITKLIMAVAAALLVTACGGKDGSGGGGGGVGLGKADAPVKLIEYASPSCGHCAQFNNEIFPQFKAKYIDTGVVHYEMREILTEPYNFAAAAFLTAQCAGDEKYYDVLDAVFTAQQSIVQSGDLAGGLRQIALSAGLSETQWQQCVNDEKAGKALRERVEKNVKMAQSTPTFYINGKKVKEGVMTLAELDAAVAAARAGK